MGELKEKLDGHLHRHYKIVLICHNSVRAEREGEHIAFLLCAQD